jgi:hypothetical protein
MPRRMRTQTNMPTILIYTLCSHVISKFNVIDSFNIARAITLTCPELSFKELHKTLVTMQFKHGLSAKTSKIVKYPLSFTF